MTEEEIGRVVPEGVYRQRANGVKVQVAVIARETNVPRECVVYRHLDGIQAGQFYVCGLAAFLVRCTFLESPPESEPVSSELPQGKTLDVTQKGNPH